MKVFWRVTGKTLILVLIVLVFGGAAYCMHGSRESSPQYAIDQYLSLLVDGNTNRAFQLLDQSENTQMSQEEYEDAVRESKYVLNDSFDAEELARRSGTNGEEYVDYHVSFTDASGAVAQEQDFTVKKQANARLGIFDRWKVLSSHCMISDLRITVPTGSTLYLDGEQAGVSWLVTDGVPASKSCYQIPSLFPGEVELAVRHPVLEAVNMNLDPSDGDQDYSELMGWKQSAKDACFELAVTALKQLYLAAGTQDMDQLDEVFADCLDDASAIAGEQAREFYPDHSEFSSVGIYAFDISQGDPVFTDEGNGAISMDLDLSYQYVLREDVEETAEGEETEEAEETEEESEAEQEAGTSREVWFGDAEAKFVMSWYGSDWHVSSVELSVIPED